jgi:hypothetical protein
VLRLQNTNVFKSPLQSTNNAPADQDAALLAKTVAAIKRVSCPAFETTKILELKAHLGEMDIRKNPANLQINFPGQVPRLWK